MRFAQVKEETAQRAGDTEQNAWPPSRTGAVQVGFTRNMPTPQWGWGMRVKALFKGAEFVYFGGSLHSHCFY